MRERRPHGDRRERSGDDGEERRERHGASVLLLLVVERLVALAFVLAVPLMLLLLEELVFVLAFAGAIVVDRAHARVMPDDRRYNPLRNLGAWRNW